MALLAVDRNALVPSMLQSPIQGTYIDIETPRQLRLQISEGESPPICKPILVLGSKGGHAGSSTII